jgi:hypothetical protein
MPIDTIVPNSLRYGLCLGDGPGVGVSQLLWDYTKQIWLEMAPTMTRVDLVQGLA